MLALGKTKSSDFDQSNKSILWAWGKKVPKKKKTNKVISCDKVLIGNIVLLQFQTSTFNK